MGRETKSLFFFLVTWRRKNKRFRTELAELLEEQSKSFFDLQSSRPPGTTAAILIPVLSRRGQDAKALVVRCLWLSLERERC
jgi:hypothetical protein